MKIFILERPDYRLAKVKYAEAGGRGTWYPQGKNAYCKECGNLIQRRVSPMIIEWEPGSDIIPDFSWPFFAGDIMVTQKVRDALEPKFKNIILGPVEMIQNKKLKKPTRKSRKPRIWLPYEGPRMYDLIVETSFRVDRKASGIPDYPYCQKCGFVIENKPIDLSHLVLRKKEWTGEHIFNISVFKESFSTFYCTEIFIDVVKAYKFTNVECYEVGKIV